MNERVYETQDKAAWGPGPWEAEPDKVQWTCSRTELPCLAVRNRRVGRWCGYVGVFEGHPWYGVDYGDVQPSPDVHGGLTFSGSCAEEGDEARSICHVPEPGEPGEVWWLGFDFGHSGDLSPVSAAARRERGENEAPNGETYKTLGYVLAWTPPPR